MSPAEVRAVIGYVRLSRLEAGDAGLGMEAQEARIREECQRRGWELLRIFKDVASGKSTNGRHGLQEALITLREGRAQALVAAKLDRVSRSVVDLGKLLEQARREGWSLVLLDLGLDTSTSVGELMAHVLVSVAQFERRRLAERTREALAVRKAQGHRLGRERLIPPEVEASIVAARQQRLSYLAIADMLTADQVPTPTRGTTWSWSTVRRVVERHPEAMPPRRRRRRRQ
jgi:DNA invertase Pin-like site-specific DNA recombinase